MTHVHDRGIGPLLAVAAVAVAYEVLSIRASTRGRPWSPWRGAAFMTGCAVLAAATTPATDFAGHMLRHVAVGMVAPLGLVLGAPLTLLLRTVPWTRRAVRLLHLPLFRVVAHPVTALLLTVGTLGLLYLTPLYARVAADPTLHRLLDVHFLLAGCLFAWAVAGPDPAPRRPSVPARLAVLAVAVAAHATLSQLLYAGLWVQVPAAPADRQAGASIMYYGGDLAELLLAFALVATWRPRRVSMPARRATPDTTVSSLTR